MACCRNQGHPLFYGKLPVLNYPVEIERLLERKVNLKLWVKVKKDWRDSDSLMKNFGYRKEDV